MEKKDNPVNKAKEFAKAIVESEEYLDFVKCSEEFDKNQAAQGLLRQFQQKQREMQWGGFNPNAFEELKTMQERISQDKVIQGLVKAQEELVNILRMSNTIISDRIGTRFAFSQGGGCCG